MQIDTYHNIGIHLSVYIDISIYIDRYRYSDFFPFLHFNSSASSLPYHTLLKEGLDLCLTFQVLRALITLLVLV